MSEPTEPSKQLFIALQRVMDEHLGQDPDQPKMSTQEVAHALGATLFLYGTLGYFSTEEVLEAAEIERQEVTKQIRTSQRPKKPSQPS